MPTKQRAQQWSPITDNQYNISRSNLGDARLLQMRTLPLQVIEAIRLTAPPLRLGRSAHYVTVKRAPSFSILTERISVFQKDGTVAAVGSSRKP